MFGLAQGACLTLALFGCQLKEALGIASEHRRLLRGRENFPFDGVVDHLFCGLEVDLVGVIRGPREDVRSDSLDQVGEASIVAFAANEDSSAFQAFKTLVLEQFCNVNAKININTFKYFSFMFVFFISNLLLILVF